MNTKYITFGHQSLNPPLWKELQKWRTVEEKVKEDAHATGEWRRIERERIKMKEKNNTEEEESEEQSEMWKRNDAPICYALISHTF